MTVANNTKIAGKAFRKIYREIQKKWYQLSFVKPKYWIRDSLHKGSIAVDCGPGNMADFSQNIIQRYNIKCFGFEPTRKHHAALDELEKSMVNYFKYHKLAISTNNSMRIFFESSQNVSGSLLNDHINMVNDITVSYKVKTITIDRIFDYLRVEYIDLLKLDIEGEEYPVLKVVSEASLRRIAQLVVEFHHYCVDRYSEKDTRQVVQRLRNIGFKSFTNDGRNYLFFWT